jgi:serine/threonine-protein kinase
MAKDPDDRYPSAGDLARDALAAADRQRATVREGSVATGRAAPTAGSPPIASTTPEVPPQLGDAGARAQARAGSPDHRVEGVRELLEFVARPGEGDPLVPAWKRSAS